MSQYSDYKDLTPLSDAENVEEYLNALKWALKQDKIKNIALAGPYGAGKSSIIDTFLEKYKDENFCQNDNLKKNNSGIINKIENFILQHNKSAKLSESSKKISMATFMEANIKDYAGDNKDCNEKIEQVKNNKICISADEVEKGILKQLFYTIGPEKIPQSRYRKLHKENFSNILMQVALYSVIALIFTWIFFYEKMASIFSGISALLSFVEISVTRYLLIAGVFIIVICLLTKIIYDFSSKYRIKGIKLSSNVDIQKEEETGESVFNKNLDEIVYFFEATGYRVIFFEDLDRLDDRTIFVHLRELNNLLNSNESINEKVVFVYAVKDDIFTKEDRTKFFDFIIPVIPVINSTNSGEVLLQFFEEAKKHKIEHNVSREFILDVAPYIADMRILRNIYNEFLVYKKILRDSQGVDLKDEQMLAIIIYKNMYPNDFAAIQNEEGLIKNALEAKKKFISNEKAEIQVKIIQIQNKIDVYTKDMLKSLKEIKIAMLSMLVDYDGIANDLSNERYFGSEIGLNEILDDNFKLAKLYDLNIHYVKYISFKGYNESKYIEKFSELIKPYVKKIEVLNTVNENGIDNLRKQIERLQREKSSIAGYSLKYIMEESDEFIFDDSLSKNKLLIFLLRRGYIDEKYANYINYFKGNSITKDDMNFLLAVKNREPKSFDYSLTKTEMVIQRLQNYEFERKEIYNFALLEYLLEYDKDNPKLELFFSQLADENNISWKFIDEFIDRTNHINEFIKGLARDWHGMWWYITQQNTITYDRQLHYLCLLLSNIADADIPDYDVNNSMKEYFENHADILQKLQEQVSSEKITKVLLQLKPCFKELNVDGLQDTQVLDTVCDNDMYEINVSMLNTLIGFKAPRLIDDFECQPYTVVVKLGDSPISHYIHKNIKQYVTNVVLKKAALKDESEHILELFKRLFENNDYEVVLELVKRETFKVDDISSVLSDFMKDNSDEVKVVWQALLEYGKLEVSWENIKTYWKNYGFDDCINKFITDNVLRLEDADKQCCDDEFISELIKDNLSENVYKTLLPKLHIDNFNVQLSDIPIDNLYVMVRCKYFAFSIDRFKELRKLDEVLAVKYISLNQNISVENIDESCMDRKLLRELLVNDDIKIHNKNVLLRMFAVKYMTEEIAELMNQEGLSITKDIFEVAWNCLELGKKKVLFFLNLDLFTADDFEKYLREIGGDYAGFSDGRNSHKVELPYTKENKKLLEQLVNVNYINTYRDETNKDGKRVLICRTKKKG